MIYRYTFIDCRGDDFYPTVDTLLDSQVTRPSKAGVERMVQDLEKQFGL
jgi:hypothetical protein